MKPSNYNAALIVLLGLLALLVVTCLLSTMHSFMGGSRTDVDFVALNTLQRYGIGFSMLLIVLSVLVFATFRGVRPGLSVAWQHVPGWLLFASGMLIFLALVGELSYFLMRDSALLATEWINHAALLCMMSSSVAACFVYAVIHAASGAAPYLKERW
ncbi:MAG: hypothetical protein AAGA33_09150 [Pseudomonadota bacterium]